MARSIGGMSQDTWTKHMRMKMVLSMGFTNNFRLMDRLSALILWSVVQALTCGAVESGRAFAIYLKFAIRRTGSDTALSGGSGEILREVFPMNFTMTMVKSMGFSDRGGTKGNFDADSRVISFMMYKSTKRNTF